MTRPQRLRVSAEPAFAARWLLERLGRFSIAHPRIELELETTDELRVLGKEADIAIRYVASAARRPRGRYLSLLKMQGVPVIAGVRPRPRHWNQDTAVLGHRLLHDDDGDGVAQLVRAAGLTGFEQARHLHFTDYSLTLAACERGQGVALGSAVFIERGAEERPARGDRPHPRALWRVPAAGGRRSRHPGAARRLHPLAGSGAVRRALAPRSDPAAALAEHVGGEGDRRHVVLDHFPHPLVAGVADLPGAGLLRVAVAVEGGPAHRALLHPVVIPVLQVPQARRRCAGPVRSISGWWQLWLMTTSALAETARYSSSFVLPSTVTS